MNEATTYYQQNQMCCFTLEGIVINDKGKKNILGMPKWKDINNLNFPQYCYNHHRALAILTGKKSNITVIDFDLKDGVCSYDNVIEDFPDLKNCYTVRTWSGGYHVYCLYDKDINTTVNAFECYSHIDIRNDEAIVFAPPTKVFKNNVIIGEYKKIENTILPFPDGLKDKLKQNSKPIMITKENNAEPSATQIIVNDNDTEPASDEFIAKYLDYSCIIDANLIGTHTNHRKDRFKFIKASSNIGVPFDVMYDNILKDIENNDKKDNLAIYSKKNKTEKTVGWNTIKNLAFQSNPEKKREIDMKWKEFDDKILDELIDIAISSGTEYDFANALSHTELCYDGKTNEPILYSTGDKKNMIWCYFKNHKWSYSLKDTHISLYISNEFYELFDNKFKNMVNQKSDIEKKINEEKNKLPPQTGKKMTTPVLEILNDELEDINKKIKIVGALKAKLKSTVDKRNIAKELFDIVNFDNKHDDKNFIELLDINPYLLCCKNGVLDLKNKVFRDGKPTDMCSLSTNIDYKNTFDEKIVNEVETFFQQVFPYESQLHYMMNHLASCLFGTAKNNTLNYYIGAGSNGKSMLVDIMGRVLGDYKQSVPLSLICSKRQTIGGTSSEIYRLRGARYAVIQEPSKNDVMNEGVMKELTGGDPITCRELYMPSITYTAMFNLIICANVFINIASNDDGTWRRIKPTEFSAKFKDIQENPDEDNFEYVKDKNLKDKVDEWKEYILYKLSLVAFENQGVYEDNEMIVEANKRYRLSQNKIQQFIDEMIIPKDNEKIKKSYVGENFKHWMELKFKYSPKSKDLFDELDKIYDSNTTYYQGFELKEDYNEGEEDKIVTKHDKFKIAFEEAYTITNEKKDRVLRSSIQEWAKNRGLAIQSSKGINPILKEHYQLREVQNSKGKVEWVGLVQK